MARPAGSQSFSMALSLGIGRIDEDRHPRRSRYERTQELQPLCAELSVEEIDACHVAAWPSEAGDQTELDRVVAGDKEDRDCRSRGLGRQRRTGPSGATITDTCRRTNSAASAGSRSYCILAQRYSIATFSPST